MGSPCATPHVRSHVENRTYGSRPTSRPASIRQMPSLNAARTAFPTEARRRLLASDQAVAKVARQRRRPPRRDKMWKVQMREKSLPVTATMLFHECRRFGAGVVRTSCSTVSRRTSSMLSTEIGELVNDTRLEVR